MYTGGFACHLASMQKDLGFATGRRNEQNQPSFTQHIIGKGTVLQETQQPGPTSKNFINTNFAIPLCTSHTCRFDIQYDPKHSSNYEESASKAG